MELCRQSPGRGGDVAKRKVLEDRNHGDMGKFLTAKNQKVSKHLYTVTSEVELIKTLQSNEGKICSNPRFNNLNVNTGCTPFAGDLTVNIID